MLSMLSFAGAMTVLAVTPGPGVFAVLGRSLNSGFRKALFLIAGIVTGDLLYLGFALNGLTWLARNVNGLFTAVRIAGGLYLIFLGIKAFRSRPAARNSSEGNETGSAASEREKRSPLACYMEGLIITLSNPKVILFYCSFLPAFMDLRSLTLTGFLQAALIVCAVLGLVMTTYAGLAARTGQLVRSPRGLRLLNRGSGSLMCAAGGLMIFRR
jgi:threonine/homoserine/homoserine lactone efflux protein